MAKQPPVHGTAALTHPEVFTYADYRTWEDRWELIHGIAYSMSPAPNRQHQEAISGLARVFLNFFKGKPCKAYLAPFDVILPEKDEASEDSQTVVQPDLLVYCDPTKLTDAGATGAPDLVVEILSPSTASKDMGEKFKLYEAHGVREYWVVNTDTKLVLVFALESGFFGQPRMVRTPEHLESKIFPGLIADLSEVF